MLSHYSSNTTLVSLLNRVNNLDEPKPIWNERSAILGIPMTFMIVSFCCNSFRLYTRLVIVKSPGWDDLFVAFFMLSGSLGSIMIMDLTNHGLGKHFIELSLATAASYLKRFYIANACYVVSTTFIKLSLLLQYLRILEKGTRLRHFTVAMVVIISIWGFIYTFMSWFPCFPVSGYWNLSHGTAKCYAFGSRYAASFTATYESHAGFNVIFDLIVLAIPVPIYLEKGNSTRTRRGLLGLFIMGVIINIFSIWRLATIVQHRAATYPTLDPTWYGPASFLQACLEVDAASICASISVFWPVLTRKYDKIFVTNEITITRSHRHFTDLGEDGDTNSMHSRSGSQASLQGIIVGGEYKGSYVLEQVNPIRDETRGRVETNVTVGAPLEKQLSKTLNRQQR